MSINCKTVYLDKDGKESKVYNNNLHLGHNKALELYAESMKDYAFTKFQKNFGNIDKIIEESKFLKVSGKDDELYIDTRTGRTVDRVTHALSSVMPNASDEHFRKLLELGVIRAKAYSMVKEDPGKYFISKKDAREDKFFIEQEGPIWEEAVKYYEANPDIHKKRIETAIKANDFKREGGTEAHDVADAYVIERNKLVADKDGYIDYEIALDKALVGVDNKVEYTELLKQVEVFLKKVGSRGKVRFVSELTVADFNLGVGGSIDLLAVTESGEIAIFDYKTKEVGTEDKFFSEYGKLSGAMKDLPNSRETTGALQLSVYRLMLEKLGFDVTESTILYIEGKSEEISGKLRYTKFKHKKDIPLPYHRSILVNFFSDRGVKVDEDRITEEGKVNNSTEFMNSLHGGIERTKVDNKDRAEIMLNSIEGKFDEITKETKMSFYNHITGGSEFLNGTRKEKLKQIESYLNAKSENNNILASQVVNYFGSGKKNYLIEGRKSKRKGSNKTRHADLLQKQANDLLAGLHPDTHTLQQLNSFKGYEHTSPGYMVAIDKIDGTATFIHAEDGESRRINFDDKKSTTIFGNHIGNATVKRGLRDKAGNQDFSMEGWDSTTQNFALIELGLISAELLKTGMIKKIYNYRSAAVDGRSSNNTPAVRGITEIFTQLKLAAKLTEESHSKYYTDLFGDTSVMNVNNHKHNVIKKLIFHLETGFTDIQGRADTVDNLLDQLKERENGVMNDHELLSSLFAAQDALHSSLSNTKDYKTVSDISKTAEAQLLSRAILQIKNIDIEAGTIKEMNADYMFRNSGRMMNPAIQALDSINKSNKQVIVREFDKFKAEHRKVAIALLKDADVSIVGTVLSSDSAHVFEALFEVDPNLEITGKANDRLFTLRDVKSTGLSQAQINYINFFNRSIESGFSHLLGSDSSKFKRAFKPVKGKKATWEVGRIPLMHASHENTMQRAKSFQDKIKRMLNKLDIDEGNIGKDYKELNTHLRDTYSEQMGNDFQGSSVRRSKLGLSRDGDVTRDPANLETNLEVILDNFIVDNLMSKSYTETLGVYNAVNVISYVEDLEHFHENKALHDYFTKFMQFIVFNEQEGKGNKLRKPIQKTHTILSLAALGFSTGQMLLETTTNSLAATSALAQQLILQAVGSKIRFSTVNFAKAGLEVTAQSLNPKDNVVRSLINYMGLHKLDPEVLASKDFQESKKNAWFQSKWAYWLNNIPYKNVKTQIFVAQLMHLGAWKAISSDSNGVMQYDVTQDGRFEDLFDRNGELYKNITDVDLQLKKAEYDQLVKELSNEGGLNEDGRPSTPLATRDVTALQDYSLSLFGSMGKDSKMVFEASLIGILILKFKGWVPVKIQNYYTPTHPSQIRSQSVWLKDPSHENGGFFERKPMINEGIIQTVAGLSQGLYDIYKVDGFSKGNFKGEFGKLHDSQKENLAKLTADTLIITTLMMMAIALQADDEDDEAKSKTNKLFMQILQNSTADLNMIQLSRTVLDNSPLAAASFLFRAVDNLKKAAAYLYTGDGEAALRTGAKMFGASKFPLALYDDNKSSK